MAFKVLRTKKAYQAALERFEEVFQANTGTSSNDEADMLARLIKQYEDLNFVIQMPEATK